MHSSRLSPVVLALGLALWLGCAVPGARAASPPTPAVRAAVLAEGWSWSGFIKFWQKQGEKTSGVVGIVLLVGFGAVLLILSKSRR